MRFGCALVATALLATGCALPRPYGEGVGFHTLLSGGYSAIDHGVYEGHPVYGIELMTREAVTGWGWELGGTYGAEDQNGPREPQAEFDEFHLGLRRAWVEPGRSASPYVGFGGGYAKIENTLHDPGFSFDDEGGVAYARAGCLWSLGRFPFDEGNDLEIGFDLRGLVGDDYNALELTFVVGAGG